MFEPDSSLGSSSLGEWGRAAPYLLRPVVFQEPDRLVHPPSWLEHIPFAFWIVDALRPDRFVELGTQSGNSYAAFAQAVAALQLPTACYAIDTWRGDVHTGAYREEVFNRWRDYHDRRFSGFSTLIRATFDEAVTRFADGSIDLLHIDGYHTFDASRHDFAKWLPKMSRRGVVLIHDINVTENGFRLLAALARDRTDLSLVFVSPWSRPRRAGRWTRFARARRLAGEPSWRGVRRAGPHPHVLLASWPARRASVRIRARQTSGRRAARPIARGVERRPGGRPSRDRGTGASSARSGSSNFARSNGGPRKSASGAMKRSASSMPKRGRWPHSCKARVHRAPESASAWASRDGESGLRRSRVWRAATLLLTAPRVLAMACTSSGAPTIDCAPSAACLSVHERCAARAYCRERPVRRRVLRHATSGRGEHLPTSADSLRSLGSARGAPTTSRCSIPRTIWLSIPMSRDLNANR